MSREDKVATTIRLPGPRPRGRVSVEAALRRRRSIRDFLDRPVALSRASQLLWAAQGVTSREGDRTAPSAGGLLPIELYLVAGRVRGLAPGVYRYLPAEHALEEVGPGDRRRKLAAVSAGQRWVGDAPLALLVAAVPGRTAREYGWLAERYVHMEVGHVAQNVYLQATAEKLGTVVVVAFDARRLKRVLGIPRGERPLAIMPVGWPAH